MKDGQYRLLWTDICGSKKIKSVVNGGPRWFRLGCHLVYTWLLPWCDDEGRMPGEPLKILANVIPHEGLTIKEIEKILIELHRVGLIIWYEIENEQFIQVTNWEKHQRIRKDRYKSSIYPACQPEGNQLATNCPQTDDLSPSPTPSPTPNIYVEQARRIFDYWKEKTGKAKAIFSDERKNKIIARLKDGYSEKEAKRAIDGCLGSEYHTSGGYVDIGLIFRNAEKFERFRNGIMGKIPDEDEKALAEHKKKWGKKSE